ncbi:cytochrome c oxidase biogenesis protein [Candidatus Photodesmus blepharus]|uniref:Cytochrome c oxidase biogenesis protein n=2 Tax=Candidatus Photodesmus blepharonis TaxID=1179155 RepID=A0A084CNF6_9GAMM|nr:cytochrome c oxidase biogenesis protein [Candidatus Photodesmus blepharus]
MCCLGCQTVSQAILDNGLASYYQYRTAHAERTNSVPEQLQNLIHYDDKQIQSEFVRNNANISEVTLALEGSSCSACAWLIEKQLSNKQGVISIRVSIATNRALLTWDNTSTKLSALLFLIHQLGYKAIPFEINNQEATYHRLMRQYLCRLGVAGLATMQVMMCAIVLYLEIFGDLDSEFKNYFRWVSLIFTTPVLLYSASPFYLNAWRSLKGKVVGVDVPVSIALILAYIFSLTATITKKGEVFFESISMFTFFLLIGRFLEMRARKKSVVSTNLLNLAPNIANTCEGKKIPVKALKIGQKIQVFPNEYIPIDGKIILGNVYIDESMLTGESISVKKIPGDIVYAGTLNGNESFTLEVCTTKSNSMISNIIRLQNEAQISKPKIVEITDVVARHFVTVILIISACTWIFWHKTRPDDAFWIMLSVLVSTCPCALSLATPTALTCATSRAGKLEILLRNSHVFETFCKVNHLIVDKTGTLTHGQIEICDITTYSTFTEEDCLEIAGTLEMYTNHPIAHALKQYQNKALKIERVKNIVGCGLQAYYKGKLLKIGNAKFALNSDKKVKMHSFYLSLDNKHIATFTYTDPIRSESKRFVDYFKNIGTKITLLTGDSSLNANILAKSIGIDNVIADLKPDEKLSYLEKLKTKEITLVIGDGINDAPILAAAHLSIAMGGGTDLAKVSSDMILLGDRLDRILQVRELALKTRKIIYENLAWSLTYNLLVLPLAVTGFIPPYLAAVGMSASSVIVLSNSLRLLKE